MLNQHEKKHGPAGWRWTKVREFAPLQRGFDLPVSQINEGPYPVVFSNGVLKKHSEYKSEGPGVVTGRSGTIGQVHFVEESFWPHNTSLWVTDFNGNVPKFVYYFYEALHLERFGSGSGVPTLNRNDVHAHQVYVPTPKEQKRIVKVLEVWDRAIELVERKIALKREVKKGLMQRLLTGKVRLPGFSGGWKSVKLGDVGKVSMCKRILKAQTTENGDVPFFKIGTFGKEPDAYISHELYISYKQKYNFPKIGEILISASGTIGRTVVYDGQPAYFQDSNIVWISNDESKVLNAFLRHTYQITEWKTANSTIARLYNDNLARIEVRAPGLDEQRAISNILSATDIGIELLKEKLTLLKDQKKYLLNNLVTGAIRTPENI